MPRQSSILLCLNFDDEYDASSATAFSLFVTDALFDQTKSEPSLVEGYNVYSSQ